MRIKEGFNLRRVGDENVIVAQGIQNINFSKIISLNGTAAFLWKEVEEREFSADLLAELIFDRYDIDIETARKDAAELLEAWLSVGIISE